MIKCIKTHLPKKYTFNLLKLVYKMLHCKKDDIDKHVEKMKQYSDSFYNYISKNWLPEYERWHREYRTNPYNIYNTTNNAESIIKSIEVNFYNFFFLKLFFTSY